LIQTKPNLARGIQQVATQKKYKKGM